MALVLNFSDRQNKPLSVETDPRDKKADVELASRIGFALNMALPGWGWRVEIPPGQQVVIVRNLTVDLRGKFGFVVKRGEVLEGEIKRRCLLGAAELLERWEHQKKGAGRFRPSDVTDLNSILVKPQV